MQVRMLVRPNSTPNGPHWLQKLLQKGLNPITNFIKTWPRYRPQMKFVKVMFLHVSVCPQGGVVSQHAVQVVSQHALQVSRGVASLHALQVSRPTLRGEVEVSGLEGSPCPHLRGWGLQAHIHGGLQAHTLGGLQAHTWGVSRPTPGGNPACTEVDTLHPHSLQVDCYCRRRYASLL